MSSITINTEPTKYLLEHFAAVARPVMRACGLTANSCIMSSQVTLNVLRVLKIPAKPIPTTLALQVHGKKYAYLSGFKGAEKARMQAQASKWEERPEVGWAGHLVVLACKRYLIDTTLDQATSEDHGVIIPSEVLVIDLGKDVAAFRSRALIANVIMSNGLEVELTYGPIKDYTFKRSDAWEDEAVPLVAEAVVAAMGERILWRK